ncbi:hypothetical protein TTHERM_00189440 (macronuclear) [Tetrahymena thermophila SB210]|uniref:Leucine rich repeat protein n=1 Tax=Tetrahymena thermophila (strain SB210) TaxID=312017 RepID=I7MJI1_TETTS|nr:hypothetical protein TTHERM_00189440 [Tetrahymena thermophila SB210]EAR96375.1 hypothetical protein TTHERM_00189440 [Tetrahymena thermophila SB210]|eukprot:XP_001016620.1 hypothetical protein TTHERM_00189440 [Tetrahymena thermophila SB210]
MQVEPQKSKSINLSKKELKSFNKLHLKQNDIKEIEELNLSANNIESTDNISLLTNLKALNISSNLLVKMYGLPKSLILLNASNNKINELFSIRNNQVLQSCFDQMANLTILDLSKNNIAKLHSNLFDNCKHLSDIDLSHNKISDQLECFVKLPDLIKLNLSYNKITDLNSLCQLKGCLVIALNVLSNTVTKQNSLQCENLLRAILPNIQSLTINQERSLTPQPMKNQKIEKNKNSSALPDKTQKQFISPFKKRLSIASTDSSTKNLSAQRQLQFDNVSFMRQVDPQNETQVFQDFILLNNSFVQPRQDIPQNACIFSSASPFDYVDNQQKKIKLQENNENDEKLHNHNSCLKKISILQQKQKMDQELINQQTKMIQDLVFCKNCEEQKKIKQVALEEISFKEDTMIQKSFNLTYLKAKFDILMFAFSKQTKLNINEIDDYLKQVIGDKVILTSEQKCQLGYLICDKVHSANNSKQSF